MRCLSELAKVYGAVLLAHKEKIGKSQAKEKEFYEALYQLATQLAFSAFEQKLWPVIGEEVGRLFRSTDFSQSIGKEKKQRDSDFISAEHLYKIKHQLPNVKIRSASFLPGEKKKSSDILSKINRPLSSPSNMHDYSSGNYKAINISQLYCRSPLLSSVFPQRNYVPPPPPEKKINKKSSDEQRDGASDGEDEGTLHRGYESFLMMDSNGRREAVSRQPFERTMVAADDFEEITAASRGDGLEEEEEDEDDVEEAEETFERPKGPGKFGTNDSTVVKSRSRTNSSAASEKSLARAPPASSSATSSIMAPSSPPYKGGNRGMVYHVGALPNAATLSLTNNIGGLPSSTSPSLYSTAAFGANPKAKQGIPSFKKDTASHPKEINNLKKRYEENNPRKPHRLQIPADLLYIPFELDQKKTSLMSE